MYLVNVSRMIWIYFQQIIMHLLEQNILTNFNVKYVKILELFFSSSVRTIGTNNYPYFMESFAIGIGALDSGVRDSVVFPETQNQKPLDPLPIGPLKDYSLFGNDSDCSDLDELEVMSKGLNIPNKEIAKDTGKEVDKAKDSKVLCLLDGEDLLCEVNGESNLLCLRLNEGSDLQILLNVVKDLQGEAKKLKVQEGDLLVITAGKMDGEDLFELLKKTIKKTEVKHISPSKLSKEIVGEVEKTIKDSRITVIIAKILSGI